jgi:hypothetical protein
MCYLEQLCSDSATRAEPGISALLRKKLRPTLPAPHRQKAVDSERSHPFTRAATNIEYPHLPFSKGIRLLKKALLSFVIPAGNLLVSFSVFQNQPENASHL